MATEMKYWRLRLKGERSAEEIQSAVGQHGGNLVRIHVEGGNTDVYFAAQKPAATGAFRAMAGDATPEEVGLDEVTRIG